MTRPPKSTEERTVRALRDAGAITGPEQDATLAALSETEPCPRCGGTGQEPNVPPIEGTVPPVACSRCEGTGEQYVIH